MRSRSLKSDRFSIHCSFSINFIPFNMNIDQLQEIYSLASQALKGRKRLDQLHNQYILNKEFSRRKTTSYNAKCADIMENIVNPAEQDLKKILTKDHL